MRACEDLAFCLPACVPAATVTVSLHAQNVAMMAGALGPEVDQLAQILFSNGTVRVDAAEQALATMRGQ